MTALKTVTGVDAIWETGTTDRDWLAESAHHYIKVNLKKMLFVVRDHRAYDVDSVGLPDDSQLVRQATVLLEALGARPAETLQYQMRSLGRITKAHKNLGPALSSPSPPEKIARKMFLQRTIGGIRIEGDKLVFSFALDGTFRKLLGRWRRIDYGSSTVFSSLSQEQFVQVAVDELLASGVDPDSQLPVLLGTVFVPYEISPGVFGVDLKGFAKVRVREAEGDLRWRTYTFAI